MESPKIMVVNNHKFGRAVIAIENIAKDKLIAEFDGKYYTAKRATLLPNVAPDFARNHAIQFGDTTYRCGTRVAPYANHSCNPNCGIKDLFKIVSMRPILKGEEITWDYEMSEDSDWRMNCE
jgi:uncharacterized protein